MFDTLASIQEQCERLGLNEEAKVIKAWVGAKLPHLLEEARLAEELHDLYHNVSTLPPDSVPSRPIVLRSIEYNTGNKKVRQIMGEIGYLLHSLYRRGYLRYETAKLPRNLQQAHIRFGILIKELVGLFGAYYNSVNKEDILQEELTQVTELWNTSLRNFLRVFNDSLLTIVDHANKMLGTSNEMRNKFLLSAPEVRQQAERFFSDIQSLNLTIRKIFPHSGARLSLTELEQLRELLTRFRDFLESLDELDSNLDLQGKEYSPQALLYWSVVFQKEDKKRAAMSAGARRRDVLETIQDKAVLQEYTSIEETTHEHMLVGAKEVKEARKAFYNAMRALKDYNKKVGRIITSIYQHSENVESVIGGLRRLQEIVEQVRKEMPEADRELQAQQVITEYRNVPSQLVKLDWLVDKANNMFPGSLDIKGTGVLDFQYGPVIDEYVKHRELMQKKMELWYKDLWMGEIREEGLRPIESAAIVIENRLKNISESPMEHLGEHEKFWTDILTFGNPLIDKDEVTPGFAEAVEPLLDSDYYEKTGLDQKERVLDLAHKVGAMNSIVGSYLEARPLRVTPAQITELETFVKSITEENFESFSEEYSASREKGETPSGQKMTFDQHAELIVDKPPNISWFESERVVVKPPIKTLFVSPMMVSSTLLGRAIFATGETFNIPYYIEQEDGSKEQKALQLSFDLKESKFLVKILSTVNDKAVVSDQMTYKIPDVGDILLMIKTLLTKENGIPAVPLNDLAKKLTPWYEYHLGEEEEELEEEDEAFRPLKKPSALRGLIEPGTPLTEEQEKKKRKGRGDIFRLKTVHDRIKGLPGEIPSARGPKQLQAELDKRASELREYKRILITLAKNAFISLRDSIISVKDDVIGSEDLLPVFPRVLYTTYDKIRNASEAWNSWKVSKLQTPLSELNALLNNMETREQIEERLEMKTGPTLQGFARITIDMINQKFEELRRLASS